MMAQCMLSGQSACGMLASAMNLKSLRPGQMAKNRKETGPKSAPKRSPLIIPSGGKWFRHKLPDETVPANKNGNRPLGHDQITQLRSEAIQLLKTDFITYQQLKSTDQTKRDDFDWIKTVLANGTVNDKLAANTILIQDSPAHNLRSLEMLIRFVNPKGKREAIMAIDTVRDLFIGDLLIPRQKLCSFEQSIHRIDPDFLSDFNENAQRKRFLVMAHVEDQIRSLYKRFLDQLVTCSHDTLETLKMKSIRTLFDLFVNNPEQEKYLLECLINKLGDPTSKVASSTARLLSQILTQHPPMKPIVVKEVERLLFRTHLPERTQYYALCFLSEIIFSPQDQELANRIINTYFAIFTKCTKLGEVNGKTMSVLLTGVSRAFPYSKLAPEAIQKHLETFYRLIHYVSPNTAIQTISLIFNMVQFSESGSLTDRYYGVLYRFLLDIDMDHCSKLNLLLNVVYRSMKKDPIHKRVRAFIKRLLQISLVSSSSSFAIATLILVSELLKTKDGGLLQVDLSKFDDPGNDNGNDDGSRVNDDGHHYDGEEESDPDDPEPPRSWVYVSIKNNRKDGGSGSGGNCHGYRADARNPLYVNADRESIWELVALSRHFHPTVQMFANKLLQSEPIDYDGDPLDDFALKRFLDRFSFKNPKKIGDSERGNNVFARTQPNSADHTELNVNSEAYLNRKVEDVPVDERFIFQYLQEKKVLNMRKKKKQDDDDDDSDIESVTSVEFNDLLDNYEKYVGDDDQPIDYAKDFNSKNSSRKNRQPQTADDEEADFDEEFDDDDDFDDGADFDEELDDDDEAFDLDDQDVRIKKPANAAPFAGKRCFSAIQNDIFASAEEFDHLLDGDDDGSEMDLDDDNDHENSKKTKSKQKKKIGIRKKNPKRRKLTKSSF